MDCLNKLFPGIFFLQLISSIPLWTHLWFDSAVIVNGLLLLNSLWKEVWTSFYFRYSCCNTWLDLQNLYQLLKRDLVPVVLSDWRMPWCFVVSGLVWNLLHSKHFLITAFDISCSLGIQTFSFIVTIVNMTLLCVVLLRGS